MRKWGFRGSDDGQFGMSGPCCTIDKDGTLFVADRDNNRVQVFTLEGKFLRNWGAPGQGNGQFDRPIGITITSQSVLYVMDARSIQLFRTDGTFLKRWRGGLHPPQFRMRSAILCDADDQLYVVDAEANIINLFENNADALRLETFPAMGGNSHGIVCVGRELFISDCKNDVIKAYQMEGYLGTLPAPMGMFW